MSGTNKFSCPWNKDIIVWERWEIGEENGRKEKKKKVCWSCEKEMRNKIGKRVGKWILLIKIGEFTHQNFLVKVVMLLGIFFSIFIKLTHQNNFGDILAMLLRILLKMHFVQQEWERVQVLKRPNWMAEHLGSRAKENDTSVWNTVVQILILASARIVCNIVYVQVRDRIHREMVKYWCLA